ncbi:hypothetical protein K8M07_00135 [Schnuerera sp. xch1]|uniref:restriction endonuclease n=1 Tax=Schnuerera sp. xch1 TaxID=2874283 RepID=UPI001CBB6BE3|nr:restriction endonuclease [Schnuerera sp. xch1]MBZ2173656.1 hypothetical protein [Schnuerera sp. xch1]
MEELLNFKNCVSKIRKRLIVNNYYTRKIKGGKSVQATLLDNIFLVIVVATFLLIIIFNLTNDFDLTVMLTIVLGGFYFFISLLWRRGTRYKKINEINEDLANKQVIKEISKYGNRDFLLYVKELLENYYNTTFFEYDKYIDFIGEIEGEIYGIKCFKNSLDNGVNIKDLEHFTREMKNKNIKDGIIVTSSYFSEEVKEKVNYVKIDFDQIKIMLKETGNYPSNKEIEELIITKYNNKRLGLKNKLKIKGKKKIIKFILLGIALYLISFFVTYQLYYRIMAFISISAGIVMGIYNSVKYVEQKQKVN